MIVGLAGYARSGKDEAAKALVAQGFERRAFADKLREFLYALNPIVGAEIARTPPTCIGPIEVFSAVRLQGEIDKHGWDGYKENSVYAPEIRELLQRLGTECGRKLIDDDIWIDAALGYMTPEGKHLVVPDVRFPNEADEIINRGGMLIRIKRPGVGPANVHASETALDNYAFFDRVIQNNGSINDLHDKVRRAVALHF